MSHNDLESDFTSPPLLVSTLDVRNNTQYRNRIETIVVNAGNITRQIRQTISPGNSHQELFSPPLEVLLSAKFSVSIRYSGVFRRATIPISLDLETLLREGKEKDGKQVYSKTERDVAITIGFQSLPSTVKEIVAYCSRFRLLIIGKSGVGKSALINKVFGVSSTDVSDSTRGRASIEQEHIAPDNDRFIVHDSRGFEAADHCNLDAACNFITSRRRMKDLKDQLHAVWLCLEIPFAGGRLLESGVEGFLQDRDQILGNVPLVVVFTKLDSLVDMLRAEALRAGKHLDNDALEERKREALERYCLAPLRMVIGKQSILHVAVSINESYKATLATLVEKTTKDIRTHIKHEAVHCIASIAQRVNISLKVAATIAIGEKRYWRMLMASPNFRGHTLRACLDVLHNDIVTVWNFKDPHRNLYGENFKERLLETPDPQVRDIIVLNLYKASHDNVRQLIAYIVDLTCVMQALFFLIAVRHGDASTQAVSIAIQAHEEAHRRDVHADTSTFPVRFVAGGRDEVLDKIKELIWKYHVPDENIEELRLQLH